MLRRLMDESATHLAFIVGHYKAGSTWLLNMLCLHPEVRGIRETHAFHHVRHSANAHDCTETLFHHVPFAQGGPKAYLKHQLIQLFAPILKRWKPTLAIPRRNRPAGLLDLSYGHLRGLRQALLIQPLGEHYLQTLFQTLWVEFGQPTLLLEKTPQNIAHLKDIRAAFPQARLIAVYRDGRDVAVSARAFRADYQGGREQSVAGEATAWRDAMQTHLDAVARGDLIAVAYEDLQRDPQTTLRGVLEALELPCDEPLVEQMVAQSSFEFRTGRQRGEEAKGRFDRKGVAGDWINHFDEADKTVFKEIAGDLLIRLGYEQDNSW